MLKYPSLSILPLLLALTLLSACSTMPQTSGLVASAPDELPRRHLIENVPFHAQEKYQCGPASLAMALNHESVAVSPDDLVAKVYVPERKGAFQVEMLAATRSFDRLSLVIDPDMTSLIRWLDAGQPVLVLQNLAVSWYPQWHYAVAIGYDLDAREIILHSGTRENYRISMDTFERTWKRGEYWGMVTLTPGELPLAQDESSYFQSAAAFEKRGSPGMVEKAWATGVAQWPGSRSLRMGYGNFLYGQGDFKTAAEQFRHVIDNHPDYGPAYNNLADTLIRLGDRERARRLAQKAIEVDPDNSDFYRRTLEEAGPVQP